MMVCDVMLSYVIYRLFPDLFRVRRRLTRFDWVFCDFFQLLSYKVYDRNPIDKPDKNARFYSHCMTHRSTLLSGV
jgi:hypothetical protein